LLFFLASTLLITAGTYWTLGRLVIGPVELLADGARRLQEGDFGVRLSEPARHDEVAALVKSFNAMADQVQGFNARLSREVEEATRAARAAEAAAMTQRRLAAMGELAAGIAHEINNPLGGLQNAVTSLRRTELAPAKREQYLGLLERGLERIGATVARLLRFTPRSATLEALDLAPLASDALDLVRHRAEQAGIALSLERTREPARVLGARNEIGQAILNLLVNALDVLESQGTRDASGPRIVVRIEARADGARLAVRDNGPGVAAEELGRIGDLFYSTKEVGRGSGLGLALVMSTMSQHGGRLELQSEPGRWFEAELVFPQVEPAARGGGPHP
jgi:signal transduction histidine kinase